MNRLLYSYGFNGQERDDEIAGNGNSYTAEYWQYDSRLGRRWNIDPVIKEHESPYACFSNNPIWFSDPNGADSCKAGGGNDLTYDKAPTGYSTVTLPGGLGHIQMPDGSEYKTYSSDKLTVGDNVSVDAKKGDLSEFTVDGVRFAAKYNKKTGEFLGFKNSSGELFAFNMLTTDNLTSDGNIDNDISAKDLRGPLLILLGADLIKKRFTTPGALARTSIASTLLGKIPIKSPVALPTFVKSATGGIVKYSGTKIVGRFAARWIPVVGWVLTAYDIYNLPWAEMSKSAAKLTDDMQEIIPGWRLVPFAGK